jgi:succinoglycan biosynthesis protein ExoM
VHWHHEERGNISHARNRCVDAASGHWIAFVDDDEAVHEGWIAAYDWLSERVEADGFFGPVLPRLEVERSHWLDLPTFYARRRRTTGAPVERHGACSANAFLRRALLRQVRFDPAFGRTLGEDTDCFLRASDAGARFVWCDEACVDEFIPQERHRPGYLTWRALEGACAWSHIEGARDRRPAPVVAALALARCVAAAGALPFAALGGRRRGFRAWLRLCTQIGRLYGTFGGRVRRPGW